MVRNCKNCNELIYAGKTHCASCGCKWIENRITMRQVGHDFADMYIGLDTKFVRTFLDLFRRPEAVILGYMNGRRVNYMDAVRYILLSLFVTGIYMFIMKNSGAMDEYLANTLEQYSGTAYNTLNKEQLERQLRVVNKVMDYQSLIVFLTIPILALAGRITFWGKRYFNYTEQLVFYMYTYSQIIILTTPISLILLWVSPELFTYWSYVTYPAMFLYNAYCYKRCFKLDLSSTILKSLVGFITILILLVLSVILSVLLGFIGALIADKLGYDVKGFFETNFG
ncbi:uncharacterized protein DUF3667 [Nonlabens dokdonensis]|jgi:hypothetical protein|uniref:DUF3667 domain-containing protein n=2 Tax=Nonlabens dokdonensis TaxID=328515 RepID=L7W641_NONDD|nr:DUF3667 domain-containing protein [Nonlabens dokdonensis]AGC75589.1 hypothetical protein DDD_0462 [Nonlabens dokdonensis DSW-6]PZX43282.1 uncharacterized protein DUF3667 [Nonlabens dokdonensis]